MINKINIGLVGLGHVSKYQIDAIKQLDSLNLIAVCDKEPFIIERLGNGVRGFKHLDELLECDDIEVIIISTPTSEHYSMGLQVINSGKGLLLEKPAAENNQELNRLIDLSKKKNVFMSVALHASFGMEVLWFCQYLKSKFLGSALPSGFSAEFYDPYVTNGKIIPSAMSLKNSWIDSGINALSVIGLFINPDFLEITDSYMSTNHRLDGNPVHSSVDFRYKQTDNYMKGNINTNWTLGRNYKATRLSYDNGERIILLDHSAQEVKLIERSVEKIIYKCENGRSRLLNHYIGLFSDFIKMFKEGKNNLDFSESIHALLFRAKEIGAN